MKTAPSDDYIWALFCELRKELVESQKTRAQIIGFKITLLGTSIAVIVASLENVPVQLLIIPAFAAIFFDLLINSYSVGIKRIGVYVRRHLEPALKSAGHWPLDLPTWEEYMSSPRERQRYSFSRKSWNHPTCRCSGNSLAFQAVPDDD